MRFTKRYEDGSIALERHVTLSEALQRLAQFEDIAFEPSNNTPCPGYSQYRSKTPGRDYLSTGTIVAVRKAPASPSITFQNNSQNNFQNFSPNPIHTRIVCVRDLGGAEQKESEEGEIRCKAECESKSSAECSDKCANARGGCGGKCGGKCGSECGNEKEGEAGHAEEHGNNAPCTSVPCKTGNTLFVLTSDSPLGYEATICTRIRVRNNSTGNPSYEVAYAPSIFADWGEWVLKPEDFGIKVFLNQQDAENARDGRRDECGEGKEEEAGNATQDNADSYTPVPCKPGDTMFVLTSNSPTGYVVVTCTNIGVRLDPPHSEFADVKRVESDEEWRFRPEDFGKMVFLRRQDVLNALKNSFR